MNQPKTALVLGGGGTLGADETGFVRRLGELGIPIDLVVGTSVGALNAAYVAFHDLLSRGCGDGRLNPTWSGQPGANIRTRHEPLLRQGTTTPRKSNTCRC